MDGFSAFHQPIIANVPVEMALLGALLTNNSYIDLCGKLQPEHFVGDDHGALFAAIQQAVAAGRRVDGFSLKDRFPAEMTGVMYASMIGLPGVPEYARLIVNCFQSRELIALADKLRDRLHAGQEDASLIASDVISKMDRVAQSATSDARKYTLNQAMDAALAERDPKSTMAVATGFRCFDDRLGELEPGRVYILGARPTMGKTSLALQIGLNAAISGANVLMFELEMEADEIGRRALAGFSHVSATIIHNIQRKKITSIGVAEQLVRARRKYSDLPMEIDCTTGQTPAMVAARSRTWRRKHPGRGLILIDHLSLLKAEEADSRHGGTWATSRASNTVLQIAKDSGCPVLMCVQLSRAVENREDKRPTLQDLRQSGEIEQDAHAVGFIYRPEVYLIGEPERKESEHAGKYADRVQAWREARERSAGRAEIIWAKVRGGMPGIDHLTWDGPTTSFSEGQP